MQVPLQVRLHRRRNWTWLPRSHSKGRSTFEDSIDVERRLCFPAKGTRDNILTWIILSSKVKSSFTRLKNRWDMIGWEGWDGIGGYVDFKAPIQFIFIIIVICRLLLKIPSFCLFSLWIFSLLFNLSVLFNKWVSFLNYRLSSFFPHFTITSSVYGILFCLWNELGIRPFYYYYYLTNISWAFY